MPADYYSYLTEAVRQNVLPLTSSCNLGCIFCSHRQNPSGVVTYRLPALPVSTIREYAQLLDAHEKVVIGESATRLDEGEPFTHPEIIPILKMLREMLPNSVFAITTNGTLLTAEAVQVLTSLAPLELTISLNSATPGGRRLLMHDSRPQRALQAVEMLSASGLSFHGSLVAMPHIVGMEDIEETVRFLAERGARSIRAFLPGYTAAAPQELQFPLQLWKKIVAGTKEWSKRFGLPVIPEPHLPDSIEPDVWGVMPQTPAEKAGMLAGDIILAVNDKPVRTRVEAFTAVKRAANPQMTIKRAAQQMTLTLTKERRQPPGFVALYDFNPQRAETLLDEIRRSQAAAPLLLASEFGTPMVRRMLELFAIKNAAVRTVYNHFFGGSIKSAGLLTVADFLPAAKDALDRHPGDLLFVPYEAFDWRRQDLTGQSVDRLSQELNIPVRIV